MTLRTHMIDIETPEIDSKKLQGLADDIRFLFQHSADIKGPGDLARKINSNANFSNDPGRSAVWHDFQIPFFLKRAQSEYLPPTERSTARVFAVVARLKGQCDPDKFQLYRSDPELKSELLKVMGYSQAGEKLVIHPYSVRSFYETFSRHYPGNELTTQKLQAYILVKSLDNQHSFNSQDRNNLFQFIKDVQNRVVSVDKASTSSPLTPTAMEFVK